MARPIGNVSRAWAGAVAGDAAAGDVAFTSPGNATVQDEVRASVALSAQSSQYLKATTFDWVPPIPATATINRLMPVIKGRRSLAANAVTVPEAKFIQAGTIAGSSFHDTQELGSDQTNNAQRGLIVYGRGNDELGGLTWDPTDLTEDTDFGLAFRVAAAGAVTAEVDAMGMLVWWQDTVDAVCTALSPTTGQPAGTWIWCHAYESIIGASAPSRVKYRWHVKGPPGWKQHVYDPRRGDAVNQRLIDFSRGDVLGRVIGVYAYLPGTYSFYHEMFTEDGTRTVSNTETFTIDAKGSTVYHVKPSTGNNGNTGLSEAQAWATWAYAVANATDDSTILLYDDETFAVTGSAPTKTSASKWWVKRSGTGTAKPLFAIATNLSAAALTTCTDVTFDGIDFGDYFASDGYNTTRNVVSGNGHTRISFIDCECNAVSSVLEITSTNQASQIAMVRNDWGKVRRYVLFGGGERTRDFMACGNTGEAAGLSGGEAMFRLAASGEAGGPGTPNQYGQGANIFANDFAFGAPSGTAVAYTAANPTVVTHVGHGLASGNSITFSGSTGTSINGARTVTVLTADTFTVPVNVSVAGTANYTVNEQAFIRPGWTNIDSWANRVNRLLHAYSEGADGDNIMSWIVGNRYDGDDWTAPTVSYTNQRNAIDLCMANIHADGVAIVMSNIARDCLIYPQWLCWTASLLASHTDVAWMQFGSSTTTGGALYGLTARGNLLVGGASWNSSWFRDNTTDGRWTAAFGADIGENCVNKGASTNWRNANTGINLATWNALDAVDGDEAEATLVIADLTEEANWLPGASFTTARSGVTPIPGVHHDYRFVNRDYDAAEWGRGCTGTESLPEMSDITATVGDETIVLEWTAVTDATKYRVWINYGSISSPAWYLFGETTGLSLAVGPLANDEEHILGVSVVDDLYNESAISQKAATPLRGPTSGRIYGTSGISVDFAGQTAWSNPENVNGEAADDLSYANSSLSNAGSDFLCTTLPATELAGTLIAVRLGARLSSAATPEATSQVTVTLYNESGTAIASVGFTISSASPADQEELATLTGGTIEDVAALIAAGVSNAGASADTPNGLTIEAAVSPGATDFRAHEVWLQPVFQGESGGIAGGGIRGRGRARQAMRSRQAMRMYG